MHSSGLPHLHQGGLVDGAHKGSIEAGKINPVIGSRHPLRQVPAAVAEIGTGPGRGKLSSRCDSARRPWFGRP
jgi:hypothetical protein